VSLCAGGGRRDLLYISETLAQRLVDLIQPLLLTPWPQPSNGTVLAKSLTIAEITLGTPSRARDEQ
jgi:hypothetical protein